MCSVKVSKRNEYTGEEIGMTENREIDRGSYEEMSLCICSPQYESRTDG